VKRIGFFSFLWICAAGIILWLLTAPIVMNEWARRTWKEMPCHLDTVTQRETLRFYYEVNGQRFVATRVNFWQIEYEVWPRQALIEFVPNTTCWISPGNAEKVVLRLDATTDWTDGIDRLGECGLIVGALGVMTVAGYWRGKRRKTKMETPKRESEIRTADDDRQKSQER
jgi:hypothetical protein